jgi:hypothetical protein
VHVLVSKQGSKPGRETGTNAGGRLVEALTRVGDTETVGYGTLTRYRRERTTKSTWPKGLIFSKTCLAS